MSMFHIPGQGSNNFLCFYKTNFFRSSYFGKFLTSFFLFSSHFFTLHFRTVDGIELYSRIFVIVGQKVCHGWSKRTILVKVDTLLMGVFLWEIAFAMNFSNNTVLWCCIANIQYTLEDFQIDGILNTKFISHFSDLNGWTNRKSKVPQPDAAIAQFELKVWEAVLLLKITFRVCSLFALCFFASICIALDVIYLSLRCTKN